MKFLLCKYTQQSCRIVTKEFVIDFLYLEVQARFSRSTYLSNFVCDKCYVLE